ncbi:MAG: prephenate dehydratase [Deltaproteobacteria bacterium]|nr:prephenate dehydratase [Deltaproteobacteria bacterium]
MKNSGKLKQLRKRIDSLDVELVKLLNKRASIAVEVGKTKLAESKEFYVPEREREVLNKVSALSKGPLNAKLIKNIYREIMSATLSVEKPLKIAFLGPLGTFTHQAAMQHFGLSGSLNPKKDISEVFDAVDRGMADYGVVPVESSAEGAVTHTLDLFVTSTLKICAEVMVEISMSLLNKSGKMEKIAKVCSHPHGLAQCSKWLKTHMPNVSTMDVSSTAMAAEMASMDSSIAAISSEAAAKIYDLKAVERKIEDNPNNITRFLVISKKEAKKTGHDKTSVLFAIKDAPGALFKMLGAFARRNINLTKIESRPLRTKAWQYVFFVDIDGHATDKKIKDAIHDVSELSSFIKVLGSYPKSSIGA